MKVLHVMAGADRGGAETAFVDTCLALKEAGAHIEAATRANDIRVPLLKENGIPVHILPFGGFLDFYTSWRMKQIIKKIKPDVIQTWLARSCAKTPRWKPSMGIPEYKVVARLGGYYKIKYFKSADYFIAVTPEIKNYLKKQNIPAENIVRINNFAETETIQTPVRRSELDTPEEAPLLLSLGRLHTAKAFDTLIEVMAGVPGAYLWIAGEGPERETLEGLIRAHELNDRVKLLGWRNDRAALFQTADICVFPSRFEPFGTVFVQAWANKTPLVTMASDGPKQFIKDGKDALMVPIDDKKALKNAIKTLMENKKMQKLLAENGYKRYKKEFSKERTMQDYLDFYNKIKKNEKL